MKFNHFFKFFALVLVVGLMAGCLFGCGGGENPTQAPESPAPSASQSKPSTPTEPQPTEPQPTEPQPTESQPTEPQPTEPQPTEPEFVCRPGNVVVHVYAPQSWDVPNIWAWNNTTMENLYSAWPGEAMFYYEGHFVMDIPVWVDSLVINGLAGSVQTADIAIESGKEVWIVITDFSCNVYYQQPTEEELNPPQQELPENITVHVYAPDSWTTPNLWAWNNQTMQNLFSAWPGQAMEASGDHYTLVIPSWVDSLVVNGQAGSVQTADIAIELGKDVWVVIHGDSYTLFYSQPTEAELDQLGY